MSLHINGIKEASELETDVLKNTYLHEASRLLQTNRCVVGRISDYSDHLQIAQSATLRQQFL